MMLPFLEYVETDAAPIHPAYIVKNFDISYVVTHFLGNINNIYPLSDGEYVTLMRALNSYNSSVFSDGVRHFTVYMNLFVNMPLIYPISDEYILDFLKALHGKDEKFAAFAIGGVMFDLSWSILMKGKEAWC